MNVEGRIIAILPLATGEGKNGLWRSQDAVVETDGQYPKKIVFNLFGDKIDQYPLAINDMVNVHFEIDSREHQGRWYPSIKAWKVEKLGATAMPAGYGNGSAAQPQPIGNGAATDPAPTSDLPF
jgi:hypothetical protein